MQALRGRAVSLGSLRTEAGVREPVLAPEPITFEAPGRAVTILVPSPFAARYPDPTYVAGACSKCGVTPTDEDTHTAWHREFAAVLLDLERRVARAEGGRNGHRS